MCDLTEFLAANPKSSSISPFSAADIARLQELKVEADVIGFLGEEGIATYRDGFLSTTLPQDQFDALSDWGFAGPNCHAFLKTAFGGLLFLQKGKVFQLDPLDGCVYRGRFEFCDFMNLMATMDAFAQSCYLDVYLRAKQSGSLKYDEIYALVPALPLGGSLETSSFQVVKMREHLGFLAQLFNNKARTV